MGPQVSSFPMHAASERTPIPKKYSVLKMPNAFENWNESVTLYILWKDAFFHNWYLFLKNSILFMKVCSILLFTEASYYGQAFELLRNEFITSLKANLRQDINSRGFTFGMEHFFGRRAFLRLWYIKGVIPSRNWSTKLPDKSRLKTLSLCLDGDLPSKK